MSEVNGENSQGGEIPETPEVNGSSLSSQMKDNISKIIGLVEKLKVDALAQEKLALEEENNNQEVEHLVSQMTLCNEDRESILPVLNDYANYVTIRAKLKVHEQSMEVIVKELQQQNFDLNKERRDRKEALIVEVKELGDKIDDMRRKLNDLEERFNDY